MHFPSNDLEIKAKMSTAWPLVALCSLVVNHSRVLGQGHGSGCTRRDWAV